MNQNDSALTTETPPETPSDTAYDAVLATPDSFAGLSSDLPARARRGSLDELHCEVGAGQRARLTAAPSSELLGGGRWEVELESGGVQS